MNNKIVDLQKLIAEKDLAYFPREFAIHFKAIDIMEKDTVSFEWMIEEEGPNFIMANSIRICRLVNYLAVVLAELIEDDEDAINDIIEYFKELKQELKTK